MQTTTSPRHVLRRSFARSRVLPRASLLALAAASAAVLACSGAPDDGLTPLGEHRDALFANDKACYEFFVGKGLKPFQAAGIVGNLDQESGASPTAVQPGGPGRGIAQWSAGGRWDTDKGDNLAAYASSHGGVSVWGLDIQLEFIWYELSTFSGYGLAALKATTNVRDATVAFQNRFEGCGTCVETQRVKYAEEVLAAYGSTPPPAWGASFVSQSFPLATTTMVMSQGETVPAYIELKNTGTKTWDKNTKLATTQPRDRASVFYDSSWPAKNRLAAVSGTVPPGGTYKFKFDFVAPESNGVYSEFFGVVQEGTAWFSDSGQGGPADDVLEAKIQVVTPKFRGVFKDQTFPLAPKALTVHVGDVAAGYIELTNKGTETWKAGVTKLAPTPRDKASAFADASWLSPTRVSTLAADVLPGAVGRFEVALDAKAVGDTTIGFGLVEEGVAWFSDSGQGGPADGSLAVHLVVVAKEAPLDAGASADSGTSDDAGASDDAGLDASHDGGEGGDGGLDPSIPGDGEIHGSCSVTAPGTSVRGFGLVALLLGVLPLARRRRAVSTR